jgi:hypothetical protein
MAQAKKKTAMRTAKKGGCCKQARKKCATRTAKQQQLSNQDRIHVYIITAMSMIAGILLCANAAMMVA